MFVPKALDKRNLFVIESSVWLRKEEKCEIPSHAGRICDTIAALNQTSAAPNSHECQLKSFLCFIIGSETKEKKFISSTARHGNIARTPVHVKSHKNADGITQVAVERRNARERVRMSQPNLRAVSDTN